MREHDPSKDWNLLLVASSSDEPARILRFLAGAIGACGGWVLSRTSSGEQCAEVDFEFPRANCVEIYSILVAAGITLSLEAHLQLTELCHCTKYLLESRAFDIVRLQLTVYSTAIAAEGESVAKGNGKEAA